MNDKISFIADLLNSKKITVEEKTRVLNLTKGEFINIDFENSEIKRRLNEIENQVKQLKFQVPDKTTTVGKSPEKNTLPDYKNPKDLRDFLLEYNQNPILKYTCHTIDNPSSLQNILLECEMENYDFKIHLAKIQKTYKRLSFKYKDKVLKNITTLISVYLGTYLNKKEWSEEKIKIKWISPELLEWTNSNPAKVPSPLEEFQTDKFRFPTIDLKNGETLTNFSDLVIYFKNLFHFKSSNKLKNKIDEIIFLNFNDNSYDFQFDSDFYEDIEIFTYSDSLMQAIVGIIKMSKQQFENEKLNVKFFLNYNESSLKEFKIVTLNSKKFKKHANALTHERYGDDFSNLINNQLNGLCNFYLQAEFEDKKSVGIINIWDGLPLEFIQSDKEIEGVEFILKMY